MRYFKSFITLIIPVLLLYFLNNGFGSFPPLGKIMDPVHGFMSNAETKADLTSKDIIIHDKEIKGNVYFDERLVPHIYAQDDRSLYFLQGYVTAQNRLWQMDIQTRAAGGRLSEIFGERFIPYDLEQRRKGMVYAAEIAVEELKKDLTMLKCVQAYTDGVNAFLGYAEKNNDIGLNYADYPIEFKLINYKPEPWTLLKTALLLKYMANTLTGFDDDMETTNLLKLLGEEDFNLLYPDRPSGIDPIIPSEKKYDFNYIPRDTPDIIYSQNYYKKVIDIFESQHEKNEVGSNNWVVGSNKTKNGFPILCNDPHLQLNLPSLWYEVQLHSPDINCYGVSLPGAPAIVIGFNDSIAWGVTNAQVDVRDWYTMEFKDAKRQEYKYGEEWKKTNSRVETIMVKNGEPIIDTVIYTHYGPVVYEGKETFMDDKKHPEITQRANLVMRWTAHLPSEEIKTFYLLNRAKNYDDYRNAISYFDCPGQNFIFGSHGGDIAITQQGKFPIKYPGEGRFILNGSDPRDDYKYFIPDEQNPTIKNPARGFCSSANQHPTDSTYPFYYTSFDFEFYRNRVINNELTRMQNITLEDMQNLQQNNFNMLASEVLPKLISQVMDPLLISERNLETYVSVYNTLSKWNYYNHADSLAPTYFQIWWDTLYDLMWDEMYDEKIAFVKPNFYNTAHAINTFPEDYKYFNVIATSDRNETLKDIVRKSFNVLITTVDSLNKEDGSQLVWYLHKGTDIMHISQIPAFSRTDIHNGGYRNIVNATSETHGPSWRMVVELSDPIKAYGVYPGGQSGNPGSIYFDNFVDTWAAGKYNILNFYKEETEAKKNAKFTLSFKG